MVAPITELASELPTLLAALSLRLGSIDSVLYHESNWSPAPLSIKHQVNQVIASAHQEWPNVVSVFGPRFGRLDLLVVPPYTEPTHAYNVVMTAASVNDASTPDQLLGITRRAEDRLLSPLLLSDGKPTEEHYHTRHDHNLRCRTPERLTSRPIDAAAATLNFAYASFTEDACDGSDRYLGGEILRIRQRMCHNSTRYEPISGEPPKA